MNRKLLWLSLLGPIGLVGLLTVLAFLHLEFDFITLAGTLGFFTILGGWILFGIVLFKRMPGLAYGTCLLCYPVVQFVICFTFFFFGCLTSMEGNWGHSAPDSWVEEQERLRRENPIDPVELEKAKQELDEHLERKEKSERNQEALKEAGHELRPADEPVETSLKQQ